MELPLECLCPHCASKLTISHAIPHPTAEGLYVVVYRCAQHGEDVWECIRACGPVAVRGLDRERQSPRLSAPRRTG
jgi:hypothetical protein